METLKPGSEVGHNFLKEFNSSRKIPRGVGPLPVEVSLILAAAASKINVPVVFFSGRMYDKQITGLNGETTYQEPARWREEAKYYAKEAGVISVDGVGPEDPAASAGKAYLHLLASPICVVNGIGRIGAATHAEAMTALAGGSNVGLIVPSSNYEQTVAYLNGRTDEYPSDLPSWWGSCDLEPDDIINGMEGLSKWIHQQLQSLHPAAFRGRLIPQSSLNHILYYGHTSVATDPEEINLLGQIVDAIYK